MSDEDKTEQAIYRAAQAQALLGNEILIKAFEYLDAEYVYKWRTSKNLADREFWWHRLAALSNVRDHINKVISFDGTLAQADLNVRILRQK